MQLSAGKGKPKSAQPIINVTPLVDVVLVLLIIFMVVLPNMQDAKTIAMIEAKSAAKAKLPPDTVTVTFAKGDEFYLDKTLVTRRESFETIQRAREKNPDVPVLLRADASLNYAKIRAWLKEAQDLGIGKIDLAVQVKKS
jgi:biopolymer transport protein ExbD